MDFREGQWDDLVSALNEWSYAKATGPGRIEVAVPHSGAPRLVTMVMAPDEWDDMASVMWGSSADAVQEVKRTLLNLKPHETFAVYSDYRLEPSTGPSLSEPTSPRVAADGGDWVALDREGQVVSRFADWSEEPESPSG